MPKSSGVMLSIKLYDSLGVILPIGKGYLKGNRRTKEDNIMGVKY